MKTRYNKFMIIRRKLKSRLSNNEHFATTILSHCHALSLLSHVVLNEVDLKISWLRLNQSVLIEVELKMPCKD